MSKRTSISDIISLKGKQKIVSISLSTSSLALIADEFADIILVGDSLAMSLFGLNSTRDIDIPTMIRHGKAVANSSTKALIIVDIPYALCPSPQKTLEEAKLIISETKAQAVKIEGGEEVCDTVRLLVENNIPVCAHIGLLPQSVEPGGRFKVKGKNRQEAEKILNDAISLEKSGAFSIVLEAVIEPLAYKISKRLTIPCIGIGASPHCDGQILVAEDILGFYDKKPPKFVKRYQNLHQIISQTFEEYSKEVKENSFPAREHCYYDNSSNLDHKISNQNE